MASTTSQTPASARPRPTPLRPYPQAVEAATQPGPHADDGRQYPPELGPDSLSILEGRTFMSSNALGDVPVGSVGGLLHNDTRFISRWELTLGGRKLSLLKSSAVDYYSAAFFLTNPDLPKAGLRANSVAIRRMRFVGDGVFEQIVAMNSSAEPKAIEMRLACGADFADLFEVRDVVRDRGAATRRSSEEATLHFRYEVPRFVAETIITVVRNEIWNRETRQRIADGPPPQIEGNEFVWRATLQPREAIVTGIEVSLNANGTMLAPVHHEFLEQPPAMDGPLAHWLADRPHFESDSALLKGVFDKSIIDLAALRVSGEVKGEPYVMPAAGLPWFMTLFGRDTIIAALQTLSVGPELVRGALHLLGEAQGTVVDDFQDEEPGRILHEIRSGELTVLGEKPHRPYYGTSDATPLWLILMDRYSQFSGDADFVLKRWDKILAALNWIDRYGDRDGDGLVEYATKSPQGLGNQCWKDSWDGIQFHDGHIPFLPIATVEIQGYVFEAKRCVAGMARRLKHDEALATRLDREANELQARVNKLFWSDDRGGYYVIGLDADKKQIDSITSNMGHLLWSGIVPEDRARIVAGHLMSDHMFSGWGVRTLSTDDRGFNPIGYHCGTIWPHDNSIVAAGLARYGYRDEANRIILAQLEAASYSGFRLPEAFAGFERSVSPFPVPYPTACSPQAWATCAPFEFIRVMLGVHVRDGEVHLDPRIPKELGRISLRRIHALGALWDCDAIGTTGDCRRST